MPADLASTLAKLQADLGISQAGLAHLLGVRRHLRRTDVPMLVSEADAMAQRHVDVQGLNRMADGEGS